MVHELVRYMKSVNMHGEKIKILYFVTSFEFTTAHGGKNSNCFLLGCVIMPAK